MANDALTHNGMVLNFDAIVTRLDFVFSEKRPIHIIKQTSHSYYQTRIDCIESVKIIPNGLFWLIEN